MVVLGVDTATPDAVVGITAAGEPLREAQVPPASDGRPRHSEVLLPEIERCVQAAGGWERIDRIAIGVGPGSFTGLRIGISTARALAQARGLAIAPVGSLAALARGIAGSEAASGMLALPVIDARRGEAFAALYEDDRELWEPFVAPPEELVNRLRRLDRPCLAAGDGALRFRPRAGGRRRHGCPVRGSDPPPRRRDVCAAGEEAPEASPDQVQPVYLRPPDARRWLERDRGGPGG